MAFQAPYAPPIGRIDVEETPSQPLDLIFGTIIAGAEESPQVTLKEFCSNAAPASPRISYRDGVMLVTRIYDCAYTSVDKAIPQILGYPKVKANFEISRKTPMRDPQFPNLVATAIQNIEPIGVYETTNFGEARVATDQFQDDGFGKYNVYKFARITVEFTRPHYWVREDDNDNLPAANAGREFHRYVEIRQAVAGQYTQAKALQGYLKFGSGQTGIGTQAGATVVESIGKVFAEGDIEMIWHQIPYNSLPVDYLRLGVGKINNGGFGDQDDNTRYWSGHTLLCLGYKLEPIVLPSYEFGWTMTLICKERPSPAKWNYYYTPRPALPGGGSGVANFYQATINGLFYAAGTLPDGKSTFEEFDYRKFFTPAGVTVP